jgi:TatA/E family protein of Tat protein translocase
MHSFQLLFLDISGGEFLIILVAVFFIFGPKKMPEIARKMGRTMNELKKASSDITREFREETNSIKNELLSARESVRRETEVITKEVSETFDKVSTDASVELNQDIDPYLKNNNSINTESTESINKSNPQ